MGVQNEDNEVSPIKLLISAVSKASWPDKSLYDLTKRALVSLDSDLEEGDYEPSSVAEEAFDDLNEFLNPSEREDSKDDNDDEDEDDVDSLRDVEEDDS